MNTKTKEAGKTASFLKMLTSGTSPRVEVVKDTGVGKIPQQLKELKVKRESTKTDVPKINTDKTFKKNIVILNPENAFKGNNIADMTRSTAKNEKQRLYETNDTFLNHQELLKKYQYVADDKDMDYPTLRRAANNGIRTVGRVLKESNDMATYKNVAELQVKLQSRLKSASITAGMLDSISGDVSKLLLHTNQKYAKNASPAIAEKNAKMQYYTNATRALLEQTKNSNPTAGAIGRLTGELLKGTAGYMTFGKAAEDAVLKRAEKLKLARMKELAAARLLAQQAADTAVNTPITIAAGMADGKSRKEISEDIGKQMLTDAAMNVGFWGVGPGRKIFNEASKKGPIAGIDFEKIKYNHARVDKNLIAFKNDVNTGIIGEKGYYNLNPPNKRLKQDIKNLVGVDVEGYKTDIRAGEIKHIEKRHGKQGVHDHSMANEEDLAKIQYVLNNYDGINMGKNDSAAYRNSDRTPSKTIELYKRINGTYYVIEAVPNNKQKRIQIISAYKSNKRRSQTANANIAPASNVQNANGSPSLKNSMNQNIKNVKAELQRLAMQAHKLRKK